MDAKSYVDAKTTYVTLNDGNEMPIIGLGTWQSKPGEVGHAVEVALRLGYRHLDCAYAYQNQPEIGAALKNIFNENKVKRGDVFITSKVWNTFHSYGKATENVNTILSELQLEYIDLLLIHWPMGYEEGGEIFPKDEAGVKMRYSDVDYLECWRALEDAQKAGKVKSIGISNFNHQQIDRVLENCKVKPAVLQIEISPYFNQEKIRDYCASEKIAVTAYSPFGNPGSAILRTKDDPSVLKDEKIVEIAGRHKKSTAQVTLRWLTQHNIIAIPKSTSEVRLAENLDIFDFKLTEDEMKAIDNLHRNWRFVDISARDGDHPHFPFNAEY